MPKVSDHPGAAWSEPRKKWFARISEDGVRRHLGYFDTPEAASAAYMEARGVKASARRQRAQEGAQEGAGGPRRSRAGERASVPVGELPLEVLGDLLPLDLMADSLPGQPREYMPLADVYGLAEMVRVSRRENVSLYVVGEVMACLTSVGNEEAELGAMVRLLKDVGLAERATEVADLVTGAGGGLTFEAAVVRLSGAEDLV